MPNPPSLRFPLSVLQQEGAYLLHAYAAHQTEMEARLGETFLPAATLAHQALFGPLPPEEGEEPSAPDTTISKSAKSKAAPVPSPVVTLPGESALARQASAASRAGGLTLEQNDALDELAELTANARKTARRAFKGQTVRLHEDYQTGEHDSTSLGDVIGRAGIILASCRRDAAALQAAGGWTNAETLALERALQATGGADTSQVDAQGATVGATDQKRTQGEDYFETLLRLQNAANLQWPARQPGNTAVRRESASASSRPVCPKSRPCPPRRLPMAPRPRPRPEPPPRTPGAGPRPETGGSPRPPPRPSPGFRVSVSPLADPRPLAYSRRRPRDPAVRRLTPRAQFPDDGANHPVREFGQTPPKSTLLKIPGGITEPAAFCPRQRTRSSPGTIFANAAALRRPPRIQSVSANANA